MRVMSLITIAYHSGYGHTKRVAEEVAAGAASVAGTDAVLLDVASVDDSIHGFATGWELLNASHGIIFGTPTYMGGPSGAFMNFANATSKPWFGGAWKDKIAAGFTNSGSAAGDKNSTLNYLSTLAAQHGMIWVSMGIKSDAVSENRFGYYLGLGTQSDNAPADQTPGPEDLGTARKFGARVADAVNRWNK
jgi:NAD(P)H dehydrogenase (quinone)